MKLILGKQLALAAAAAALVFTAAIAHATIIIPNITYSWTGTCTDCTPEESSPASATLKLQGYVPGDALTSTSQVISFHYHSVLFDESTTAPFFVSGILPDAPGGGATFDIRWPGGIVSTDFYRFNSVAGENNSWSFIDNIPSDFGTNSNFQLRGPTVPEPATVVLLGLGLAGLGFSRRKQA